MHNKHTTAGFTLIEMIVSLALFSVVVTISVGALLTLIASNRQLQDEQAVLTNLSFALDSMSREIRTGSAYVATSRPNLNAGGSGNAFRSGNNLDTIFPPTAVNDNRNAAGQPTGTDVIRGVSFVEGGQSITGVSSQRILYFYNSDTQALYRRFGSGEAQKITSDGIEIIDADFSVTGSETLSPSNTERTQPAVTIYIEAQIADTINPKIYPIQTTVVQRILDL